MTVPPPPFAPSFAPPPLGPQVAVQRDPRCPVLVAFGLALGISLLTRLPLALGALAGAIALAVFLGVGLRQAAQRLLHVEGFLVVLPLLLPFTTPGQPLLTLGPLQASRQGLTLALLIALKVNAILLLLLALLRDLAPERMGAALAGLGAPARFVRLFELILRHRHTARDGLRRQSEAMRARGFVPRADRHTWRSHGHLLGGALLRALDRARRVDEAMRLRGGPLPPEPLPGMTARDRALTLGTALLALALVLLDRLG